MTTILPPIVTAEFGRIRPQNFERVPWMEMAREICTRRKVELKSVLGPRRFADLVEARREIATALRAEPYCFSYPMIGRLLHRDHTSILHLVKKRKRARA